MFPWRALRDIAFELRPDRFRRLRRYVSGRIASPVVRHEHVAFLNDFIGLPSPYPSEAFGGGLDAEVYFLHYGYLDRAKAASCLDAIERFRRERGVDFSKKTLLLAAAGLDPHGTALCELGRAFAHHHVFFEAWNELTEVAQLFAAGVENVYLVPVTGNLPYEVAAPRVAPVPNRRVFVSLGGDDDLDLLQSVVRACPDLCFFIPDVSWRKFATSEREMFEVRIRGPNVVRVRCSHRIRANFSLWYLLAYAASDTILVATKRDKQSHMRGGLRVADAIRARKRLVMTRNAACELVMAQHERTALVVGHDVAAVSAALERSVRGELRVDEPLLEEIRALTDPQRKLAWMVGVPLAPDEARRSAFRREPADPRANVAELVPSIAAALLGLAAGQALPILGGAFSVAERHEGEEGRYVLDLLGPGGRLRIVDVSTVPLERYFARTGRGHWLSYRGDALTPDEARALKELARRA